MLSDCVRSLACPAQPDGGTELLCEGVRAEPGFGAPSCGVAVSGRGGAGPEDEDADRNVARSGIGALHGGAGGIRMSGLPPQPVSAPPLPLLPQEKSLRMLG